MLCIVSIIDCSTIHVSYVSSLAPVYGICVTLSSPSAMRFFAPPLFRRNLIEQSPASLPKRRSSAGNRHSLQSPPNNDGGVVSFAIGAPFAVGCILSAGALARESTPSSHCFMETVPPTRSKRGRPPEFGATIPTITARGLATKGNHDSSIPGGADREDCPMCKKFSAGPCGEIFKRWLACTDAHPGRDSSGEPLHLSMCSDFADKLAGCLEQNPDFYSKYDENSDGLDRGLNSPDVDVDSKVAWKEFVCEMEDGIISGRYSVLPFPETIDPKMKVRMATLTGAAFFMPENEGKPIVAAYLLDDNSNVVAAGSREDMYVGDLGCVLQFKVSNAMKETTARAIYDTDRDGVLIFSRTVLVPRN
jgi:hypothetical protein